LCDNDPVFVLYRVTQHHGLFFMPRWVTWFKDELTWLHRIYVAGAKA
jgi:hypothetical protein